MPIGLTAAQKSALAAYTGSGVEVFAVKIHSTTPFRFTTHPDGIVIGAEYYEPRGMGLSTVALSADAASADLELNNTDRVLSAYHYTERLSNCEVTWHLGAATPTYESLLQIDWVVKKCSWKGPSFKLQLVGITGTYPRAGLPVFGRQCIWIVNQPECSLVGATCDGTWARCAALSNTAHFMGLRRAPAPGEIVRVGYMPDGASGRGFQWQPPPTPPPPTEGATPSRRPVRVFDRGLTDGDVAFRFGIAAGVRDIATGGGLQNA